MKNHLTQISSPLCTDLANALGRMALARKRWLGIAVLIALPISLGLALSGADAGVNLLAQGLMPPWASILWSAPPMLLGMILPLLLPLAASLTPKARPMAPQLWAAFLLSLALVSLLKALTGRIHPEAAFPLDLYQRSIALFPLSLDLFEGWPSGHVATNGAVALTLLSASPCHMIRRLALFWMLWVCAAVVLGINGQVHWLSDMIAGAILALGTQISLAPRSK